MLKSALKTSLANELDDPSDTDVLDLIGTFIDDGISDLAIKFNYRFLNLSATTTLSSGTGTIVVSGASNVRRIYRTDQEYYLLTKLNEEIISDTDNDFSESGIPEAWFISSYDPEEDEYTLQFNKLASSDIPLKILYTKTIGPISDSDHIPYPPEIIPILKSFVRSKWYLDENQPESSQAHFAMYENSIANFLATKSTMEAETVYSGRNSDLHFGDGWPTNNSLFNGGRIIEES